MISKSYPNRFRYQVITAVTWRIVEELMRRHHTQCKLYVLETHPGGGLYDCLSIGTSSKAFFDKHICDFNQQSRNLHPFKAVHRRRTTLERLNWPDFNDYVEAYLSAQDPKKVIDEIEALLGLPKHIGKRPPTTPPVLIFRLIGRLLERHMLGKGFIDIRNGWFDSSGGKGSHIRRELRELWHIIGKSSSKPPKEQEMEKDSMSYWIIYKSEKTGNDKKVRGFLNMRGLAYFPQNLNQPWNTWQEYTKNGRRLLPILNQLDEIL